MLSIIILILLSPFLLIAQTGPLNIINGTINLGSATHTATVKIVATVPDLPSSNCVVGELAIVTSATLGQQLYQNSSTSCVWTQQLNTAGTGGTVNNIKCNHCTTNGTSITNTFPNASSTGTTTSKLAKLTGVGTVVIAATSDTSGVLGIVASGAGTTGSAEVTMQGTEACVFDGATIANDYVIISATTAGDCHDAGSTYPVDTQVIGRVLSTNVAGGTYNVSVFGAEFQKPSVPHSFVCNIGSPTGTTVISTGDTGCYSDGGSFTGTIDRADIIGNAASLAVCSITVDVWLASGAYPTASDKISASAPATLSSAKTNYNFTRTSWTNTVPSNPTWGASVATVSGCVYAQVRVEFR